MRRTVALSVTAFLFAACSSEAPGGGEVQPPADAPATAPESPPPSAAEGVAKPFAVSAMGTEPFWRIDITSEKMTLSRPDAPAVTVQPVGVAAGEGGYMSFVSGGPPPGPAKVQIILRRGDCSDGMSDLTYPYKAEVKWDGETLKGCGFETAKQPRQGQQ